MSDFKSLEHGRIEGEGFFLEYRMESGMKVDALVFDDGRMELVVGRPGSFRYKIILPDMAVSVLRDLINHVMPVTSAAD